MRKRLPERVDAFIKTHQKHKKWQRTVMALAAVVVFCTTYALILPAITMEKNIICGKEEHIHTEECYTQETVEPQMLPICTIQDQTHQHGSSCCNEQGQLICGYADFVLHKHTPECYDAEGQLWCPLPEIEEHIHDDSCSADDHLICGKEEIALHEHTNACYNEDEALICGRVQILEHQHSETCFEVRSAAAQNVLVCTLEEHTHDTECFADEEDESSVAEVDVASIFEQSTANAMAIVVKGEANPYEIMMLAEEDSGIDFGKYLTGVTVQYKENNKWVDLDDHEASIYDTLRFKLQYTLEGNKLSNENRTITYQLPANFEVIKAESGEVYDEAGVKIGDYVITEDGNIAITFGDNYVSDNEKGEEIQGYIAFEANASKIKSENDSMDISFSDKVNIKIPIAKPQEEKSDLQVFKTAAGQDDNTGTVTYIINVSSQSGTGGVVNLTDAMENIELADPNGITVTDGSNNAVSVGITKNEGGFSMTLPQMGANSSYRIEYKAKLPEAATSDVTAGNTVNVTSKPKEGDGQLEDSRNVTTTFHQTYISKTGSMSSAGDKITWTLTVNAGKHDIGGWTLSDMIEGAVLPENVTMKDSAGNETQISLPHKFPEGANDTYTITYETDVDQPLGSNVTVSNIAAMKLLDSNKPGASSDKVQIGGEYKALEKKGQAITSSGNTATMKWSVTINAAKGGFDAGWYYNDELKNGQYLTDEQIAALKAAIDEAIKPYGFTYTFEPKVVDGKTTGYQVIFNEKLAKGTHFSFQYSSTGQITNPDTEETFTNKGTLVDGSHSQSSDGSVTYRPLVRKMDSNTGSSAESSHDYYSDALGKDGTLKWTIKVNLPSDYAGGPLKVDETLPDGLDLTWLQMHADGAINYTDITKLGSFNVNGHNVEVSQKGQTITMNFPNEVAIQLAGRELQLDVRAKIRDTFEWPKGEDGIPIASFENKVHVSSGDGKTSGDAIQLQKVTKDDTKPVISKASGAINNNIIPYTLTVNPDGVDLVPGSDEVTLIDTVDIQKWEKQVGLNVVPGSVIVHRLNQDGTMGELIPAAQIPYTFKVTTEGDAHNPVRRFTMRMTIPDSTPLLIEYKYKVNAQKQDIGSETTITNNARLEGESETEGVSQIQSRIQLTDSSAGATTAGATLCKVDSGNYGITLPGAKFHLYRYDEIVKDYMAVTDDTGGPKVFTTNSSGTVSLPELVRNTAYKLEEVEAPQGYVKASNPFYFCIFNENKTEYPDVKPDGFMGTEYRTGATIYVGNESSFANITVKKRWYAFDGTDITGTTGGSINVDVYQMISTEPPVGGQMVNLIWHGRQYGGVLFDLAESIPAGTEVTMVITAAAEAEYNKVNPGEEPLLTVGGSQIQMEREEGTSNFVYTFTITADTEIIMDANHYLFSNQKGSLRYVTPNSPKPGELPEEPIASITLSPENGWKWSSGPLPKSETTAEGTVYYTYYVKETAVPNYTTEYENNGGITSGTITVKNTAAESPGHELPSTGGKGTTLYTFSGLALIAGALMYDKHRRRKGGTFQP